MKLAPCKTASGRHTWEHLRNKTVTGLRDSIRGVHVSMSLKGVYRCITCAAVKYGEPLDQVPAVVPAQGVAK